VVIAARHGHNELVSLLLAQGAQTATLVEALERTKKSKKDRWDKVASLASVFTFSSTLLVALVGGAFTYLHNQRQTELLELQQRRDEHLKQEHNRVIELQTVEKMIPHLVAGEQQKRAALIAISTLASPDLAARMGQAFGGEGSVQALQSIAATSTEAAPTAVSALTALAAHEQTSAGVRDALGSVFRAKKDSVVSILAEGVARCSGFVADADRGLVLTTDYRLEALRGQALEVQVEKGPRLKVLSHALPPRPLGAAVLRISERLPTLALAAKPPALGERLIALGDMPARAGKLVGVVGVVHGIDEKEAQTPSGRPPSEGRFVRVEFADRASVVLGTAGGPILDANGNVACMIHHGIGKVDSCLSAQSMAQALEAF